MKRVNSSPLNYGKSNFHNLEEEVVTLKEEEKVTTFKEENIKTEKCSEPYPLAEESENAPELSDDLALRQGFYRHLMGWTGFFFIFL